MKFIIFYLYLISNMDYNVIFSSCMAGCVQSILGHPFDTIKTRIQIYNTNYKNTILNIYKKEGLKSYYKGISLPLISGCLQNCFMFSTENYFYNYSKNHIFSGFISGGLTSLIVSPAELIKCQIQQEKNSYLKYNEVLKKMKLKRMHLLCGFYSTFIRDSLGMSIYFGLYNYLKLKQDTPLINGGVAGTVSWIFSYPFDVIKTQKQIYNYKYYDIIRKINFNKYRKGLSVVILRSFIVNAGIFYTYESLLNKK